jgi:DNA-binding protein HU-beta
MTENRPNRVKKRAKKTMNKAKLIKALEEKLDTDQKEATDVVEKVIDTIVRAVHRGDSVTITGFGVFEQRRRAARVARNPRTGEAVRVKPTSIPAFRPGEPFRAVVSGARRLPAEGPALKRGVGGGRVKKAAKKAPATKSTGNGALAKKAATKQTSARKVPARKTAMKAAPKRTAAKKSTAKKAPSRIGR